MTRDLSYEEPACEVLREAASNSDNPLRLRLTFAGASNKYPSRRITWFLNFKCSNYTGGNVTTQTEKAIRNQRNEDPLTGAPGAHPVGTGVGALAGGMAAGAATGTVAGPVGTVIGAAVGAIVGGLAGKGVAEMIDPTMEDAYWRGNYAGRPYVPTNASYDDYGPAYRYGVDSYTRFDGTSFDDAEAELGQHWDDARDNSSLSWDDARPAIRDSWERIDSYRRDKNSRA
jgi:hypothetical protein